MLWRTRIETVYNMAARPTKAHQVPRFFANERPGPLRPVTGWAAVTWLSVSTGGCLGEKGSKTEILGLPFSGGELDANRILQVTHTKSWSG